MTEEMIIVEPDENIVIESESTNDEPDEQELINDFRIALLEHADKHNMRITDIKGWTESKIEWMALNNRTCCCDPSRTCPCDTGVHEVNTESDHMCKCSVFVR